MVAQPDDTIAAISTPPGTGAIGLVRLSGPCAFSIARQLFRPANTRQFNFHESHRLHYGHIVDRAQQHVVDEVLLSVLKAPRTYTREDTIEINCHGGPIALEQVLLLALRAGARLAEPGEFTKRAFLNGRIDLAQAEAVADIIHSQTELNLRAAVGQLQGKLSDSVNKMRDAVIQVLAEIEASIDFPEEDLDFQDSTTLGDELHRILNELEQLLQTAQDGTILREGVRAAIVGRTNVGKSSLLNALLKQERAIVAEIPGTTRDTIEEYLNIRGLMLRIVDTAGIRQTADSLEQIGIQRSRAASESADLLLVVLDRSEPLTAEDDQLLQLAQARPAILIGNKSDLPPVWDAGMLDARVIHTSMVEETGIEELKDAIWDAVIKGKAVAPESVIVTNVRHQRALEEAQEALRQALETLQADMPYELVAVDLRIALDQLGFIVGKTTTDDILERIFSQFCVGK